MYSLAVPTGPPQVVSSVAIEPTVLIIQWESPRAEHTNGVIRRYTVNVTEIESGSQEVLYSESTNVTVTSRHPFYRYSYTVSAETVGSGPFSSVDIVQMPEAGICRYNFCRMILACVHVDHLYSESFFLFISINHLVSPKQSPWSAL